MPEFYPLYLVTGGAVAWCTYLVYKEFFSPSGEFHSKEPRYLRYYRNGI